MTLAQRISDLDTFLAFSLALEEEAAERHDELADMMEVHNNPEVAGIFRKLAGYSRLHAGEVRDRSRGSDLPKIAPWDFGWETPEAPETADIAAVDYLISPAQALRVALSNERRARDFYAAVGRDSPDADVRALASEFAEEEQGHLELLEQWLERIPEEDTSATFDPDPPRAVD